MGRLLLGHSPTLRASRLRWQIISLLRCLCAFFVARILWLIDTVGLHGIARLRFTGGRWLSAATVSLYHHVAGLVSRRTRHILAFERLVVDTVLG